MRGECLYKPADPRTIPHQILDWRDTFAPATHNGRMHPRRLLPLTAALLISAAVIPAQTAAGDPTHFDTTAEATVFFPNPVQQLGDQSLTDRKDQNYRALRAAYHRVLLTDLDGSGTLTGRWAVVKSATGKPARIVGGDFPNWQRHADQFEQVMAYYWATQAQHYLRHLGFGTTLPGVMDSQIELRINQLGYDNSFFRNDKVALRFGKGGVDDAEDAEVIVHEYGHAVQNDQVSGFGTNLQSGSIGEGFSDYLAVAVSSWVSEVPSKTNEACVADWDAVSYNPGPVHCLRRIDTNLVWPQNKQSEVHADGRIWSSALYDIHQDLGPFLAGRIIIGAQFDFARGTSFAAAAQATVSYARDYGVAQQVREAFAAHGLIG